MQHSTERLEAALDAEIRELWETKNSRFDTHDSTLNASCDGSMGGTESLLTALENLTIEEPAKPGPKPTAPDSNEAYWSTSIPTLQGTIIASALASVYSQGQRAGESAGSVPRIGSP